MRWLLLRNQDVCGTMDFEEFQCLGFVSCKPNGIVIHLYPIGQKMVWACYGFDTGEHVKLGTEAPFGGDDSSRGKVLLHLVERSGQFTVAGYRCSELRCGEACSEQVSTLARTPEQHQEQGTGGEGDVEWCIRDFLSRVRGGI